MPNPVEVRRSPVHGRGAFATRRLRRGQRVIEYGGQVIDWDEAQRRHAATGTEGHTFFFDRGDGTVIDGGVDGNEARFLNHSCDPNCEAFDEDGHIVFYALRPIHAGEELFIDYRLVVDDPEDPQTRRLYACACGAASCRGVMLAG